MILQINWHPCIDNDADDDDDDCTFPVKLSAPEVAWSNAGNDGKCGKLYQENQVENP